MYSFKLMEVNCHYLIKELSPYIGNKLANEIYLLVKLQIPFQ